MTKLVSTIIAEIMETNVLIELQQKKIKALHMLLSEQLKEKDISMTEMIHLKEENEKSNKNQNNNIPKENRKQDNNIKKDSQHSTSAHPKSTTSSQTSSPLPTISSTSTLMKENLKIYTDYPIRFSRMMMIFFDPFKKRKAISLYKLITVVDSKGYFHLYDGIEGVEIAEMDLEHNKYKSDSIITNNNNNGSGSDKVSDNMNNNTIDGSAIDHQNSSHQQQDENVVVTAIATDSTDAHYPVFVSVASDGSIHVVTIQTKIGAKRKVINDDDDGYDDSNNGYSSNTIKATLSAKFFLSQHDDTSTTSTSKSKNTVTNNNSNANSDSTIAENTVNPNDKTSATTTRDIAYVTAMAVVSKSKSGCFIYTGDNWGRLTKFTCHGRQLNALLLHSPIHHSPVRSLALHNNWVAAAVDNTAQVVDVTKFRKIETDCQASELIQKLQFGESSAGQLLAQLQSGATVVFNFFLVGSPTSSSANSRMSPQASSLNNILSRARKIRPVCSITPLSHPTDTHSSSTHHSDSRTHSEVPLKQSQHYITEPPLQLMGVGLGYIKHFFLTIDQCELNIYNASQSTRQNIMSDLIETVNFKAHGCQDYSESSTRHNSDGHSGSSDKNTHSHSSDVGNSKSQSNTATTNSNQNSHDNNNHFDTTSSKANSPIDQGLSLQVFTQLPAASRNKGGIAGILSMIAPAISGVSGKNKANKEATQILLSYNEFSSSFYGSNNDGDNHSNHDHVSGDGSSGSSATNESSNRSKGNAASKLFCHLTKSCNNNNSNSNNNPTIIASSTKATISSTSNYLATFERGVLILHDNNKMTYTRPRLLNNPFTKNNNNDNNNGENNEEESNDASAGMTKVGVILIAAFLIVVWRKYISGGKNKNNFGGGGKSKFDALNRRKGFGSSGSGNNIDLNSFEYCQPSRNNSASSGGSMLRK